MVSMNIAVFGSSGAIGEALCIQFSKSHNVNKIFAFSRNGDQLNNKTIISKQVDYLNCFFDAYWKDNNDLSSDKNISTLIRNLKINSKEFFQSIKKQSVKDQLIKLTTDAFQKEVFGTPTFIVNNKIFWGQDRLEYALDEFNSN